VAGAPLRIPATRELTNTLAGTHSGTKRDSCRITVGKRPWVPGAGFAAVHLLTGPSACRTAAELSIRVFFSACVPLARQVSQALLALRSTWH
jgi:hypothetical protein